jgi:hypothetical protein
MRDEANRRSRVYDPADVVVDAAFHNSVDDLKQIDQPRSAAGR